MLCSTYEVATACALALGAEKLIFIMDGPILDESGHLIRFLTLEDADMLIRKRAEQSETAANYVKAVNQPPAAKFQNGAAKFQNGVGFDDGTGTWSNEQGFAIGGQERLSRSNGYLSELAAAAFVCRVSFLNFSTKPRLKMEISYSTLVCKYVVLFLSHRAL